MLRKKYFKDLIVWQRAMKLVPAVYSIARSLPDFERYALADQIRRAAVSVPANIAEGQSRRHPKEFLQHLSIARGSLAEVQTLILIAYELSYIDKNQVNDVEKLINEVGRLLSGLSSKLVPA